MSLESLLEFLFFLVVSQQVVKIVLEVHKGIPVLVDHFLLLFQACFKLDHQIFTIFLDLGLQSFLSIQSRIYRNVDVKVIAEVLNKFLLVLFAIERYDLIILVI